MEAPLDMTNSNPSAATVHAGSIGYNNGTAIVGGGDLQVMLNNDAAHPAVIQFNGGQLGLSEITTANGTNGTGARREYAAFSSLSGTGPLRIELTNGAAHLVTGGYGSGPAMPVTIRGVMEGTQHLGPNGTVNTGITLTTGRMMFDNARVTYANGILLEGALQILPANRATAMNGNITVAANGYVAFQGRARVLTFECHSESRTDSQSRSQRSMARRGFNDHSHRADGRNRGLRRKVKE
jgi:hypothetical protein